MADVAQATAAVEVPTTSKKTAAGKKVKKSLSAKPKSTHPPTAVMVNGAIKHLKERGGSSLQAIKKYISATYKIDAEKFSPFIKKYLRNSVASGILVQTKGKGASGSFKLAATTVTKSSTAAPKTKKATTPAKSKAKAATEKKVATSAAAKKSTAAAAKGRRKSIAAAVKEVKAKTPSKAKKTAKAPTKKPKSPKLKTTKAKVTKSAAKKTSPKKK